MLTTGSFKVKSGYVIAFVLLLISHVLIFSTLRKLIKHTERVDRTAKIINDADLLLSSVSQAESAVRGYMITKKETFLVPVDGLVKQADSIVNNMMLLTADKEIYHAKLDSIKELVRLKQRVFNRAIDSVQSRAVAIDTSTYKRGPEIMSMIKRLTTFIKSTETSELQSKKDQLEAGSITIEIITITSLIIAVILAVYSFITYSKENEAKEEADRKALSYREALEKKLHELEEVNKQLVELKSQEKFAATGRIARTIAHEVRNPLTNISLAAEQIREAIPENEETNMLLSMINRNTNRINQLISDLLHSTRFDQLQFSKADINQLIDEALELAKDRLELNHVAIIKEYDSRVCEVYIDKEKMTIAILNIIVNAIESMQKQGVLKLKTQKQGDKCLIEVTDNGSGMNEETLQRLFEPYFTNKSKGNGLGLTNTQNIILNHKGSISVTSKTGENSGSVFTIIL